MSTFFDVFWVDLDIKCAIGGVLSERRYSIISTFLKLTKKKRKVFDDDETPRLLSRAKRQNEELFLKTEVFKATTTNLWIFLRLTTKQKRKNIYYF